MYGEWLILMLVLVLLLTLVLMLIVLQKQRWTPTVDPVKSLWFNMVCTLYMCPACSNTCFEFN